MEAQPPAETASRGFFCKSGAFERDGFARILLQIEAIDYYFPVVDFEGQP